MAKTMRIATAATALALVTMAAAARGAAPSTQPARQGPLAALPSPPGPTIDKIKALGDNEWLNLGPPAADPKWGKGRGRSWGSRMPYAPDLGGAFLNGLGVHGYIKPDGRYMDDIWFYDLYAHRWICLYPGTDTKTFAENLKSGQFRINADGQLTDKDGQPIPFASLIAHSYMAHTYAADLKQYLFLGQSGGLGGNPLHCFDIPSFGQGRSLYQEQMQGKKDRMLGAPFIYDTVTGKFERYGHDGWRPPDGIGAFIEYLPGRKQVLSFYSGVTGLYDCTTHQWTRSSAAGPPPGGTCDWGACYDSKRNRVYVCAGQYHAPYRPDEGCVGIYDVKTNAWSHPPNKGKHPAVYSQDGKLFQSDFSSNRACIHYDSVNDRVIVLVFFFTTPDRRGVYVYDPETASWSDAVLPAPAAFLADKYWVCQGFYSPELNVHFFYRANDSDDRGTMWAYRYKRAAGR
jgi:hypothetical protein